MFNILNFLRKTPVVEEKSPLPKTWKENCNAFYCETFERETLWDQKTIENILFEFPKGYIGEADLFLILTECIANAILHGQAKELTITAIERHGIILLSFKQSPKMLGRVAIILSLAKSGKIEECTSKLPGGLGFPILLRLVHKITISHDYSTLRLWIREKKD